MCLREAVIDQMRPPFFISKLLVPPHADFVRRGRKHVVIAVAIDIERIYLGAVLPERRRMKLPFALALSRRRFPPAFPTQNVLPPVAIDVASTYTVRIAFRA